MGTSTRTARTSAAATADRGPSMYPPVGASGRPVMAVAGVDVEVLSTDVHEGTERLTCITFPVPGERDLWAIVSLGRADGSHWMIGIGGWQLDEYPTITSAVEAVCNRITRAQILNRTRHEREIGEAERALRALREATPAAPAGACPLIDAWPASGTCVID